MASIERADLVAHSTAPDGPGLIPIEYSQQIIQAAVESSAAMSTFRTMRMPTGTTNLPILSALPNVGWVNETPLTGAGSSDTIKPVTEQGWTNAVLTAEELAAIVVIPEAVIDDASVNLWAEITPRLGESIAMVIDETVFFGGSSGHTKPATFADGLFVQAESAGQVANSGNIIDDFNTAMGYVESAGWDVSDAYGTRLIKTTLRGQKDTTGAPIYVESFRDDGRADAIYGAKINYVAGQAWDAAKALCILADADKAILGIRQDMQVKMLDQATIDISAAKDGSQLVNLAQQDLVALRVRFRFGFTTAVPVTARADDPDAVPFSAVAPAIVRATTTTKKS